jgi:DNA-directed RNA polymerase I subunit RPA1
MRGRRRRGEGASRGELSEAARAVLERAQRAHLPTPPLSAASRSPHINTLRKQTLSRFYRSLAASRKCASCGKHSPTIRHESGCKLFCAKLPRKLQEANAAISAARGGAGDSEEDEDADVAMSLATATAATNGAEDEHGGEDGSDADEEDEEEDDEDDDEDAAPRGATAKTAPKTAPRPNGAPRRAPRAEDAAAVDEGSGDGDDDDDDDDDGGGGANSGGQPGSAGAKPSKDVRLVFISPSDAQRHLEQMWKREGDLLARLYRGLNAQSFFQRVVPVPPSRFRPPSTVGDGVFEPASNVLLGRVLAQDMELRRHLSGQPRYNPAAAGAAAAAATAGAPPDTERVLKAWEELCKSVQALTDSSKNAKSGSDREPAGVKLTLGCEADPWL